jgi:Domain of unknown function (DUF4184)
MPFTVSHAAVVLPFSRPLARWQLLPAVVVGSMVPDFRFFLPWHLQRFETHSFEALFTFCLPMGLLAYWLFEYLIKPPLMETLPDGAYLAWQAHAAPAPIRSPRRWLLAVFGILIGAVSHLIWDGFTHEGARGVRMLTLLEEPGLGSHQRFLLLRAAQDGSSLIGLLVVIGYALHAMARATPEAPRRLLSEGERHAWWASYVVVTVALAVPIYFAMRSIGEHSHWLPIIANDMAISSLRALAIAMLAVSVSLATRLHYLSSGSGR